MPHSRRDFLKSTLGASTLLSLSPAVPAFLARAAAADLPDDRRDTVLVVIQLSGGNDGLNTLVPYGDDAYGRSRRTLRLTPRQVLKIDSYSGFHPRMKGVSRLFEAGHLSVVQGVGYPNSHRGHEEAMRHWHTARPEEANCQTGWVGRAVDCVCRPDEADVPGVFVGRIAQPFALNAEKAVVPSIRSIEDCTLSPVAASPAGAAYRKQLLEMTRHATSGGDSLEEFVRRSTRVAWATSREVEAVLAEADRATEYPPLRLAGLLKMIAELIRAEVGIRIFFAELGGGGIGGFDNHANQRDNHAALLGQLSESVAAFANDLARDGRLDQVVLMTFSEFGRTLAENGRRGTGHGTAQPIFLAGGRLKGGLVGRHPSLTDLDQGAPKFHTDFRRVYATMLESWLGLDSKAVLGGQFDALELLES